MKASYIVKPQRDLLEAELAYLIQIDMIDSFRFIYIGTNMCHWCSFTLSIGSACLWGDSHAGIIIVKKLFFQLPFLSRGVLSGSLRVNVIHRTMRAEKTPQLWLDRVWDHKLGCVKAETHVLSIGQCSTVNKPLNNTRLAKPGHLPTWMGATTFRRHNEPRNEQ